jgi:hypothetical protein
VRRLWISAVLLVTLAIPGAAMGSVLSVYEGTGGIPPCQFSAAQLSHALHSIDTFDAVYFADFPNAIKTALDARASGACSAVATSARSSPAARAPLPDIPVTAATSGSVPAPMLLLALLAALGVLGAGGAWLLRRADPAWPASARHSLAEASYRLGGVWFDLIDRFSRSSRRPRD